MKKTIFIKDYKIKFIKTWFSSEKNEVLIKLWKIKMDNNKGFAEKHIEEKYVGEFYLNILNGYVHSHGYGYSEKVPDSVSNMLRREWKDMEPSFRKCGDKK